MRSRDRTLVNMQRHRITSRVTKPGILNARSIGNKHAQIVDEISSESYNFFVIVETWHDSANCPSIIACTPSDYRCMERARPRSSKAEMMSSVNHGGVYLFYRSCYSSRLIDLPHYHSVEVMAVNVRGTGITLVVVVIYCSGSKPIDLAFLEDFANIIEHVAARSTPVVVVEDLNIHLDDTLSLSSVKFNDIIAGCDMQQHVLSPTHTAGHILDVVITQSTTVIKVEVDPPVFSDYSLITAKIMTGDRRDIEDGGAITVTTHDWTRLDVDALRKDLLESKIFINLPVNCDDLFLCYDCCLHEKIDKHVPIKTKVKRGHRSEPWFNMDCRQMKKDTRRLEKIYQATHSSRPTCVASAVRSATVSISICICELLEVSDRQVSRLMKSLAYY